MGPRKSLFCSIGRFRRFWCRPSAPLQKEIPFDRLHSGQEGPLFSSPKPLVTDHPDPHWTLTRKSVQVSLQTGVRLLPTASVLRRTSNSSPSPRDIKTSSVLFLSLLSERSGNKYFNGRGWTRTYRVPTGTLSSATLPCPGPSEP